MESSSYQQAQFKNYIISQSSNLHLNSDVRISLIDYPCCVALGKPSSMITTGSLTIKSNSFSHTKPP